jgi:superfamily II DNA or RNA helicase
MGENTVAQMHIINYYCINHIIMAFFQENYSNIRYPITEGGMRLSQIGAIHAITSHFTISNKNAIISMPTGTGKTAVLMMSPFTLGANRVLVITPSKLVRYQIAEDFKDLTTLRQIGVFEELAGEIKCFELNTKMRSDEDWKNLEIYDVVITTPNCVSPSIEDIVQPQADLFDLILIDEAHHSAAKTYISIIEAFPNAKKVLFTATPFRRDKKHIDGKIIYSYPLSKAYQDGTFGKIKFEPVKALFPNDILIAQRAEEVLFADRQKGLDHALMVRTDSKTKAKELYKIYKEKTGLNVLPVDSSHSYSYIKKTLKKLTDGEIDGIICVDMLGEGYNFPKLKIAALHAPHKSLEVTLQFIGRFSRTAKGVDEAKFIGIPNDIELEAEKIYQEGKIWQELITNLSENRIEKELEIRHIIEGFENIFIADEKLQDLSLFALKPYYHVKIFSVPKDCNLNCEINLQPFQLTVLRKDINEEESTVIFITGDKIKPRWAIKDDFDTIDYNLFVIYYDKEAQLLFINSTIKSFPLYNFLAEHFIGPKPRALPSMLVNKVLLGIKDAEFFNVGMKKNVSSNHDESYKIISGSKAHKSIKASDGQLYGRGHLFAKGSNNGSSTTLGLSSASKVWSNKSTNISLFILWCKELSKHILSDKDPITNTELDFLKLPISIINIPSKVPISVSWNPLVYRQSYDFFYHDEDGALIQQYFVQDLELVIDHDYSNESEIIIYLKGEDLEIRFSFAISNDTDKYFTKLDDVDLIVGTDRAPIDIESFLNEFPPSIYFQDFSSIVLHEYYAPPSTEAINFNVDQVLTPDWVNVDITREFGDSDDNNLISIHSYLDKTLIPAEKNDFVYYDHGTGEIADFITLKVDDENIYVQFYHVKGSSEKKPGNRVADAYEVTSQVTRCVRWLDIEMIIQQLTYREHATGNQYNHRRDEVKNLADIIKSNKTKQMNFEILLVQPGISKSKCENDNNITNNLAAASDYCALHNCKLTVLSSK